ncbi:MAG: pro-sigmaK processing inhibitor BofA family protein [Clostridia bacterium]|jgi:pro-sigmaK processing inhibitor BofA|nr:pro-sigmaK processing inhibitor BofA family protein [Clostridia bacterium]MCI1959027.1 pro-sigmaK processing inhibitor BofA family protein [Clostridia bacterium]MCI1999416.1 pro-sigmaK processing inhibitor BofA family protein [Clostridia bacterium]MCI2015082.1 pro-sigmaK processing inhibitor BofA family protein [Clostridia bacterium]
MGSTSMMFVITAAFLVLMAIIILAGPMAALLKFLLRSAVGGVMIVVADLLLKPVGIYIGLNALTVFFVGLLGIPGFFTLILIHKLL